MISLLLILSLSQVYGSFQEWYEDFTHPIATTHIADKTPVFIKPIDMTIKINLTDPTRPGALATVHSLSYIAPMGTSLHTYYSPEVIRSNNTTLAINNFAKGLQPICISNTLASEIQFETKLNNALSQINHDPWGENIKKFHDLDQVFYVQYLAQKKLLHPEPLTYQWSVKDVWALQSLHPLEHQTFQEACADKIATATLALEKAEANAEKMLQHYTAQRIQLLPMDNRTILSVAKIPAKVCDQNISQEFFNAHLYLPRHAVPLFFDDTEVKKRASTGVVKKTFLSRKPVQDALQEFLASCDLPMLLTSISALNPMFITQFYLPPTAINIKQGSIIGLDGIDHLTYLTTHAQCQSSCVPENVSHVSDLTSALIQLLKNLRPLCISDTLSSKLDLTNKLHNDVSKANKLHFRSAARQLIQEDSKIYSDYLDEFDQIQPLPPKAQTKPEKTHTQKSEAMHSQLAKKLLLPYVNQRTDVTLIQQYNLLFITEIPARIYDPSISKESFSGKLYIARRAVPVFFNDVYELRQCHEGLV